MTDANNKTRIVTPGPATEKTDATPAPDNAAPVRTDKESEARLREIRAREQDLWAFHQELLRQTLALVKQHENDPAMLPLLLRLGEVMNSTVRSSAEECLEIAQGYLQRSKDYAEQAAEENDPQSKRQHLADSEKATSKAAAIKKTADELMQRVSARKEKLAAVAAALLKRNAD
jgi:hypothetical protein